MIIASKILFLHLVEKIMHYITVHKCVSALIYMCIFFFLTSSFLTLQHLGVYVEALPCLMCFTSFFFLLSGLSVLLDDQRSDRVGRLLRGRAPPPLMERELFFRQLF